jgi:hypothetical protein
VPSLTYPPRRTTLSILGALLPAALILGGCTSAEQAEQAGSPSESVLCGTVTTSIDGLQKAYAELDAGVTAGDSPTNLQPIGAKINSLTFDVVNQLQGASKESLTTAQTAAQRIVDTLVTAQGSGATGDVLAQQLQEERPEGLDAAIADLKAFAQEACGSQ